VTVAELVTIAGGGGFLAIVGLTCRLLLNLANTAMHDRTKLLGEVRELRTEVSTLQDRVGVLIGHLAFHGISAITGRKIGE